MQSGRLDSEARTHKFDSFTSYTHASPTYAPFFSEHVSLLE
jgi:hypothetical protein